MRIILCLILITFILNGCSSRYGRYHQQHDSTPTRTPTAAELKDAEPRIEPKSRGGNKHYQVRGKSYKVLENASNFKQTGIASWYGNKFHGHLTSNGEIYNMYAMSAAHKNLPLPTYVRVTNNDNNKTVIVRVNDRGPFHQNRIIDLSYSAAYKLDMLKTGTAHVTIEAVTNSVKTTANHIPKKITPKSNYIQVLATRNQSLAHKTAKAISFLFQLPTQNQQNQTIYKVLIGPIPNQSTLTDTLSRLKNNGYPEAFKLQI